MFQSQHLINSMGRKDNRIMYWIGMREDLNFLVTGSPSLPFKLWSLLQPNCCLK